MERNKTLALLLSNVSETNRGGIYKKKKHSLVSMDQLRAFDTSPAPKSNVRLRNFLKAESKPKVVMKAPPMPSESREHLSKSEKKGKRVTIRKFPTKDAASFFKLPEIEPNVNEADIDKEDKIKNLERELEENAKLIRDLKNDRDSLMLEVLKLRVSQKKNCCPYCGQSSKNYKPVVISGLKKRNSVEESSSKKLTTHKSSHDSQSIAMKYKEAVQNMKESINQNRSTTALRSNRRTVQINASALNLLTTTLSPENKPGKARADFRKWGNLQRVIEAVYKATSYNKFLMTLLMYLL